MDIKETDILGDAIGAHWYYRAKAAAMLAAVAGVPLDTVLDVGAGSGFFSRVLLDRTEAREAVCVDPGYDTEHEERVRGKPLRFVRAIDRFDGHLVLMMDVLEHVDDDVALLGEYAEKSGPGTRFFLTVPAFRWMWSGHDVFLEHRRRYTLPEIEDVARRAGLVVRRGTYLYGTTLPLAAAQRFATRLLGGGRQAKSSLKRHSPPVNAALGALTRVEAPFAKWNRVAGLTASVLAERV